MLTTKVISICKHMNAGCGKCWSIDGNWKLCFTHYMYPVEVNIPGIAVNFSDVYSKEPIDLKSVFFKEHQMLAVEKKCPLN